MNTSRKRLLMCAWLMVLTACSSGGGGDDLVGIGGAGTTAVSQCSYSTEITEPSIPETPLFTLDPLGPMSDVTCDWQQYQPAESFCVQLDAPEFTPGGTGALTDGNDPACRFSGFTAADQNLYKVEITTPILCAGCRRVFMDFSQIPADRPDEQIFYAHGHAFYRIMSINPSYTIDPDSHSPNTKNFYNDKLVSPPGTPIEQLVGAIDTYDMAYVTDTRFFAHTGIQGLHYIGPWYVNRAGERIHGIYVDVNVVDATRLGDPNLDAFRYMTGYNSGQFTCPDNLSPMFADGNLLYGGCVDRAGGSSIALDPFN
jgi:hypothetical protein